MSFTVDGLIQQFLDLLGVTISSYTGYYIAFVVCGILFAICVVSFMLLLFKFLVFLRKG